MLTIVLARQDVRDLRSGMARGNNDLHTELRGWEMAGLRADMVQMRKDVHAGLLLIHGRVAHVEARQGR